ncbi:MAG: hypothetical protein ACOH5I_23285 [Oligoflexus sp.]
MKSTLNYKLLLGIAISISDINAQTTGEMIRCSKEIGSSKTDCEQDILIAEDALLMDYTVIYDYECQHSVTRSDVILTSAPKDVPHSSYALNKGKNQLAHAAETKSLYVNFNPHRQAYFSRDCSLVILDISRSPSDTTISQWRQEADQHIASIELSSKLYKAVTDYENFLNYYTIYEINGMVSALQRIFGMTVETALKPIGGSGFPPPIPGQGGGHTIAPNPQDYGLDIDRWEDIDVFQLDIVRLRPNSFYYGINANRGDPLHSWYFTALNNLPVVAPLLVQIADLKSLAYMKEQAQEENYEFPDATDARRQVQKALDDAKSFITLTDSYRNMIRDKLERLNEIIRDSSPPDGQDGEGE